MDGRVGLWRKLSTEELMLFNYGVGEDSWESLGLQGDPTRPFWRDQPWDFFGRNDAKAETPVLWPPHSKSWLIGKDSDSGRDWRQEEKGMTEDEMAGWHHQLGDEFEWTPGDGDGQGGLVCWNSRGRKESDTLSDWTELNWTLIQARQKTSTPLHSLHILTHFTVTKLRGKCYFSHITDVDIEANFKKQMERSLYSLYSQLLLS